MKHLSFEELQAGLPEICQAPKDKGRLELIVIRPDTDQRRVLPECQLSAERGVHGDDWWPNSWSRLPDGTPNPDVQVTITSSRALGLIAQDKQRWPLAGDNLYVDLDLSEENLPCGQRLAIGSVVLEVTGVAHNGCKKYAARFGLDALKFVNSPDGKRLHLRGIYARVVQAGTVRVGDLITKYSV